MSESLTRTITENLTHDDVQRAILDLVAKRNPSFKPLPDDAITFTRKWSPPQPVMPPGVAASPISLDVDVKVVQEVKPAKVFMESTPSTSSPSFLMQQFGRAAFAVEKQTRIYDEITQSVRPASFERDLVSLFNLANRLRARAVLREDKEAADYLRDVTRLVERDLKSVEAR